ncbi:hypothetical protein [Chamaesiphon sp. VAR_48_metabat_403]|uniref:hypothetical protein n=1 Tax=Chamaesiphon sp. VAR_48_metabat_403 TaxID=2964700 RepID=UPI00286D9239|nr:hypothetical protein [Chamaesiphon sp. VAR_48_metabat_403]
MTEVRTVARQIQQLEIYLNNLVSALTRGELPVNLQPVTQIFDNAIASISPVLNLSPDRFIELYNDLPHLFTAYAIDVTLSEDSFIRQNGDIIFYRFARGNYWIIPTQSLGDKCWLVPNPLKGGSFDRMPSLAASFDRDLSSHSNNNCLLVAPALVQLLPVVEPLTWKLIERGKLTNTQNQASAAPASIIESLVEKFVKLNDRTLQLEKGSITADRIEVITNKQEQLQSISAKIIEQLATKQQEIEVLKSQLAGSNDRTTRQDREIAALKIQIGSIDTQQSSSPGSAIESKEITSLKIDLEKLKAECQQRQNQQNKSNRELADNLKTIVAQEIAKLQRSIPPEIETIEAEIVIREPEIPVKSLPIDPSANSQLSPFARLYNSGKVEFLRSYMVSTASLIKNNSQKIELVEDNIGLYWIVPFNSTTHYLVPKIDFPDDTRYLEGLSLLFDGKNDSTKFMLFKPAIVTITKANMPKQWKLEQKGYL